MAIQFNDLEKRVLRFLKDEYLEKGSEPSDMHAPATGHRDVMAKFDLDLRQYRELMARFEHYGIVQPVAMEAANGYLKIDGSIVEIVRELDENAQPVEETPSIVPLAKEPSTMKTKGKIFIGHGRSRVWKDLREFLQDRLGLECDEFNSESAAGYPTQKRLSVLLDNACFAFLVMTAEDPHSDGTVHARENVIHEVGLFQERLGFERAIVLLEEGCSQFSNIVGLTHIGFPKDNIQAASEEIRRVLEREGIVREDKARTIPQMSAERQPKPLLGLVFDRTSEDCIFSYEGDSYISIVVRNEGGNTARNFIAQLARMEHMESGKFVEVSIHGPHDLIWAFDKRDVQLIPGAETPLNVLLASEAVSPLKVRLRDVMPKVVEEACAKMGEYMFTIVVAADDAEPQQIKLWIKWDGRWDGKWTENVIGVVG